MAQEKMAGVVKSFDASKGFGYIKVETLSDPVFVHYTAIVDDRYQTLKAGDKVEFILKDAPEGPRAAEVKKV